MGWVPVKRRFNMTMGFGFSFMIFHIIFFIIFGIILIVFLTTAIRGLKTWKKNNNSPRLSVKAKVVSKRINVSRRHRAAYDNHMHYYSSTHYYATFQVESGDRMELSIDGSEYGLLAEGDEGVLTLQGTRYLGFDRNPF